MHEQALFEKLLPNTDTSGLGGITSVCTYNYYALRAALRKAAAAGTPLIIEATCNQVNQFGGYTGMRPADFRDYVLGLAEKEGFPIDTLILGGDHLGPYPFRDRDPEDAMEEAKRMTREYAAAGFKKLHLDPSMPLAGESAEDEGFSATVAERTAVLCAAAEEGSAEAPSGSRQPVYVVGADVPSPGGSELANRGRRVTSGGELEETVETMRGAFADHGLGDVWNRVIAVVVDPGVEHSGAVVIDYEHEAARDLIRSLEKYPDLVLEGHTTDYQFPERLAQMVSDGIRILKVGPVLTYTTRMALYALEKIERETLGKTDGERLSQLEKTIDDEMIENPKHWIRFAEGPSELLDRKYSLYDRARYYLAAPSVKERIEKLLHNVSSEGIWPGVLQAYFPNQFLKVRAGELRDDPENIIIDRVTEPLEAYWAAIEG